MAALSSAAEISSGTDPPTALGVVSSRMVSFAQCGHETKMPKPSTGNSMCCPQCWQAARQNFGSLIVGSIEFQAQRAHNRKCPTHQLKICNPPILGLVDNRSTSGHRKLWTTCVCFFLGPERQECCATNSSHPNTGFEILVPGLGLLSEQNPLADRPISFERSPRIFIFCNGSGSRDSHPDRLLHGERCCGYATVLSKGGSEITGQRI